MIALVFALAAAVSNPELDSRQPAPFPGDYTWAPGNGRTKDSPLSTEYFTGEFRADTAFHYSFKKPQDNTIGGSSEVFRHGEVQVTQLGIGGDFHAGKVMGRLMTQFGMYSMTTPRNDASPARGQWRLDDAYRYISEAYGGYRFDVGEHSWINVQAGIFMSYVGLWSYYNADNWTYQPSFVSSNTPWFFNGVRAQIFVTERFKIEPWLVNGWQAYGQFNRAPGVGLQLRWNPTEWLSLLGNQYYGADTLGVEDRKRVHTDDSIMVRYHNDPTSTGLSKAAASFTFDAGCEYGGGVECSGQYFLGFMAYTRFWFHQDQFGLTLGGGGIRNPGRYLVLMPPINGATAYSGTPYFTYAPGDPYKAWDIQVTTDWMPSQFFTFRLEYTHRHASVPYFSGPGGVTPPGGNQGAPGSVVPGWSPDLVRDEDRVTAAMLLRL
ncbi:MAG: outer membrane beta-barrel protein [Myxococcales bacterium]|nr:outer membrane beta-barrel protein [Myxococcales bacterium]